MTRLSIAIDLDDIVGAFNEAFIRHHNEMFGSTMTLEGVTTFDLPTLYGTDEETMVRRIMHFCHSHHHTIEPVVGAAAALEWLATHFDLHIVTSRCESLRTITEEWLMVCDLLRFFTGRHFTCGYGSIHPHLRRSKLAVCQEIGACVLIEDAPHNALQVAEKIPVLLRDRPWNREVVHSAVTRIHSWPDVITFLKAGYLR